jgi:hypothetical protein
VEISSLHPIVALQAQTRIRSQYYGFVRRLPNKKMCEIIFDFFFKGVNNLNAALDETIFREQARRWWDSANDILLNNGPQNLPEDLRYFPALIFQVLAIALQFLPTLYDTRIDELKFAPSQTISDLSSEYSECSEALSRLLGRTKMTLGGVQRSFLRDWWLVNTGDLMEAWNHSGETVR